MSTQISAQMSTQSNHQHNRWQLDGWYLSDGQNIIGPLSSREAFSPGGEAFSPDGEAFNSDTKNLVTTQYHLVSRTGFTCWYPKSQLAKLYSEYRGDTHKTIPWAKEDVLKSILPKNPNTPDSKNTTTTQENPPEITLIELETDTKEASLNTQSQENTNACEAETLEPSPDFQAPSSGSKRYHACATITTEPNNLEELYMVYGGTLRLGKLTSCQNVFFTTTASLGLACICTALRIKQEIAWHMNTTNLSTRHHNPETLGVSQKVLYRIQTITKMCLYSLYNLVYAIPLLSALHYTSIGRHIKVMERQNGYNKCSVLACAILSIFPPLSASYLQKHINQHWRYHLYLAALKQNPLTNSHHHKDSIA